MYYAYDFLQFAIKLYTTMNWDVCLALAHDTMIKLDTTLGKVLTLHFCNHTLQMQS